MDDFTYGSPLASPAGEAGPGAAILTDSAADRHALAQLVAHGGDRVLCTGALDEADGLLAGVAGDAVVLLSIQRKAEDSSADIERLGAYLHANNRRAVVSTRLDLLDDLYALLGPIDVDYCADADDVELILAMVQARRRRTREPAEGRQVAEFQNLQRISLQLGEVARSLASLAEASPLAVRARGLGYDAAGSARGTARPLDAPAVRDLIRARRLRDQYFDPALFGDPGWDILLDLMAARLERRSVSVSSLCIAAAVPPTTALRWIKVMTDGGMLVRRPDPDDARRVFIDLSDASADAMQRYFAAAGLGAI